MLKHEANVGFKKSDRLHLFNRPTKDFFSPKWGWDPRS